MYDINTVLAAHKDKRVWFYLADAPTRDAFQDVLIAQKAHWLDCAPLRKEDGLSSYMAVHHDGHIAFVSNLAWHMAQDPRYVNTILKIDYQKLLRGDDAVMRK